MIEILISYGYLDNEESKVDNLAIPICGDVRDYDYDVFFYILFIIFSNKIFYFMKKLAMN